MCTSRSENKRRVGKRMRDKTVGCDVEVGNARHTRAAGQAHEMAFVRRNVAPGGQGGVLVLETPAVVLGAHAHTRARVGSTTSSH